MGLFGRLVVMVIGIAVGFLIVWKTQKMLDTFGQIPFFEDKLGSWGGTRSFYNLLGILVIAGSVLFATGGLQSLLTSLLGSLFGSLQ